LLTDPFKLPLWNELQTTGTTNYEELFESYQAIVDIPGYLYYKTLMEKYPDAKVILSTRPFDGWHLSINSTLRKAAYPSLSLTFKIVSKAIFNPVIFKSKKCVDMVKHTFFEDAFFRNFDDLESTRKIFDQHHEDVIKNVPKENLLIYNLGEGWDPLCEFLEVKKPDAAYPHLNRKEDFLTMMDQLLSGVMA